LDAKLINPFIASFNHVMQQMGFSTIKTGTLSVKGRELEAEGLVLVVGLVGDLKGNIVYIMDEAIARQIASKMMMGMPVPEMDTMARSSLSELSNMLSAHAATGITALGYNVDISPPNMMQGSGIHIIMSADKVLCIEMVADGLPIQLNIAIG